MDLFIKIFLSVVSIHFVVCTALPLSLESELSNPSTIPATMPSSDETTIPTEFSSTSTSTTPSPTTTSTDAPIIFSHDSNPFDPFSLSFRENSNLNITKPDLTDKPFNGSPISKWASVLPLPKLISGQRQQRIHVFRPLFVYRQEQEAKKNRASKRPSIDPDRFYGQYGRPQYPHYYPPPPPPPPPHLHPYPYPYGSELYDGHFPDYIPNDISVPGPQHDWYNSAAHYSWPPHDRLGYLPAWRKK